MNKCIVTLAGSNRLSELNDLIKNLNLHFVDNNKNTDLLIFHEKNDLTVTENLERYNGGNIVYHSIDNFILEDIPLNKEVPEYVYSFPTSYRMMCQFFSGEIFKILKDMKYEYYLRLDTDSRFLNTVSDIFSDFISNEYYYGYISILNERQKPCNNRKNKNILIFS